MPDIPDIPNMPRMNIPRLPGMGGGDILQQATKLLQGGGSKDYDGDGKVSKNEKEAFKLADRNHDGQLDFGDRILRASFDKSPKDREFSNKELAEAAKALKGNKVHEGKGHDAKHGTHTKAIKTRE